MYRVAVLDDDMNQAHDLARQLLMSSWAAKMDVVAYSRASELEEAMDASGAFDIVLMDICLAPQNPDGIAVAQSLDLAARGTQVIYVTGYDHYHTSVYQTPHACFLMKPVFMHDLEAALDLAVARLHEDMERPLRVRSNYVERVITPSAISYAESRGRYLLIHLARRDAAGNVVEAEEIKTYLHMSDLVAQLPQRFVVTHKSYLINLDYVNEWGLREVVLKTGAHVPVSRERSSEVRKVFLSYVRSCA